MLQREQIMKFIPKPNNKDIIIIDSSLKDLIEEDVFALYQNILPLYKTKKQEYLNLKEKIDINNKTINNIYLYNTSWNEEDYLYKLRNDKKTYNTLYYDIKKIENSIEMLNKKMRIMNDKIQMQQTKEQKKIEDKKNSINEDIDKNRNKLLELKEKLSFYKQEETIIIKNIAENEDEFSFLTDMEQSLKKGDYKCKYCGSIVKIYSENSLIYRRLKNNLESNKKELEELFTRKEDVDKNIAYYENEILKVKIELKNDIEFKKQDCNFYTKKTIEVLKLEALRDEIINNINEKEKELSSKPSIKSDKYLQLKNDIEKCELSLENLQKLKKVKNEMDSIIDIFNNTKNELIELHTQLQKCVKFIDIYYKICEKKINDFFGSDYNFKLHKINECDIKIVLEIHYKNIEYSELNKQDREEVDKNLSLKIGIFN